MQVTLKRASRHKYRHDETQFKFACEDALDQADFKTDP